MARIVKKAVARKAVAKGRTATKAAVKTITADTKVVKSRAAALTKAIKRMVQGLKSSRTAKVAAAAATLAAVGLVLRKARRR